jgi:DNA-binding NarL/FixJ family response regulator
MCRNVLIVDDDDVARRLIHGGLAEDPRVGMLWEATDPLTACALAEILPVDVAVLDFVLAQGTAADCLPALRLHRPDARIVVYTAEVQRACEAGVLGLGADQLVQRRDVDVAKEIASIVLGSPSPVVVASASASS